MSGLGGPGGGPAPPTTGNLATVGQEQLVISTSYTVGLTLTATDTSITVSNHTRRYADKDVAIMGATLTGLAMGEDYNIAYDDPDRLGGAVTFTAHTNPADAFTSPANPARHHTAFATTATTAGGTGTGGGSYPPGAGGAGGQHTP